MIEQTKFTYSPPGKVFEIQIKTIKDQGKNEMKGHGEHGKQLFKSIKFNEEDSLLSSKQEEIFQKLVSERIRKIEKLHSSIDLKNLIYFYKGLTKDVHFHDFIHGETLFDEIRSI